MAARFADLSAGLGVMANRLGAAAERAYCIGSHTGEGLVDRYVALQDDRIKPKSRDQKWISMMRTGGGPKRESGAPPLTIDKNAPITLSQTEWRACGVFLGRLFPIPCKEVLMKRILITCIAVSLGACPGFAANPKTEAAVKTFKAVGADAAKLKTFCEMTKVMDAMGEKEDAAAEAKVQGYIKQLGAEFEAAWNTSNEIDAETPDGKVINSALDDLSGKCT
jgi:hypothetical protein